MLPGAFDTDRLAANIEGNAKRQNIPYDRFVRELFTSTGSNLEHPGGSYFKVLRTPDAIAETTTQVFLGVRFNCNKCHDHPFERWTQDQYYELTSYFAQVGRKEDPAFAGQKIGGSAVEGAKPLVEIMFDRGSGEVTHLRTNQQVKPHFPYSFGGSAAGQGPDNGSRREQLARWITSKENPYFAKSYVNRLWGYLFGRGIIEPIDDIRAGNPPTNPELLDALTADFIASGFDMQHMLRTMCKSRTYQLSIKPNEWNADDEVNITDIELLPDGRIYVFGTSLEVLDVLDELQNGRDDVVRRRIESQQTLQPQRQKIAQGKQHVRNIPSIRRPPALGDDFAVPHQHEALEFVNLAFHRFDKLQDSCRSDPLAFGRGAL